MCSLSFPILPKFLGPVNLSSPGNDQKNFQTIIPARKEIKKQSFLTIIFKSLDNFVSNFMSLPLTPSIDPKQVLVGNYAAVDELSPSACEVVEGSLPSCLDGAYIRNGPNPQCAPGGAYHLFDGDGMLHSIRISNGRAKFCSRYVRTYKFKQEEGKSYPFFESPFSSFNGKMATIARCGIAVTRVITGYYSPIVNGFGTANTSLALLCGAIFALCESDLPYKVQVTSDGDIITIGRCDFDADRSFRRMTAHPKTDSVTGEVFAFRCDIFSPFLTFFRIDSAGRKGPDLPIVSVKRTSCIHDFALTERFIVFQDFQIEVSPLEMITKGKSPVVYDRDKMPRIGIFPRHAEDETQLVWVDAPGLNMLHVINAWEEDYGDTIVIVAPNFVSVEYGLGSVKLIYSILEKIKVDIKKRKLVSRQQLSTENMEFGVINQAYAGKKNRYVYAAMIDEIPKAEGVVKLDLSAADCDDCTVASRLYGPGCYGGEPYFVPKNMVAEEDDGYLVTYMHNEKTNESWFLVMDAKTRALDIVARVKLPGRVPYGFHGLFVGENDIK